MIDNRLLKHKDYCHFIMIIPKSQSVIVGGKKSGKSRKKNITHERGNKGTL